ncbi:DNA repair protein RAD51 homolog 3-like [Chrysoperla carnea]|uniref:DNA repair protein RAD51 homolog 3-like n=1 Tax=Chrysoperla carnea TaxID=189513 RepID=UPI001D06970F|nr:DNA repair protein RAD51 homolog 3-like [Chrysoperla carnea]
MNTHTFSTMCPSLDELLHHGVKSKAITFISGARHSGKTQFCLQLAFALQLEEATEAKRTLFLSAHRLFPIDRLRGISNAVLKHLKSNLDSISDTGLKKRITEFNVARSAKNTIFSYSSHADNPILNMTHALPELIQEKNIKLIILDNIEDAIFSGFSEKDDDLINYYPRILSLLHIIAYTNDIAVVITSTRKELNASPAHLNLTIKLEELSKFQVNFSHVHGKIFRAVLYKSPCLHAMSPNECNKDIMITRRGIYDLPQIPPKKDDDSETAEEATVS